MDLVFSKVGNEWVAEFQATADFNLHLERVSSGSITVAQRGTDNGEYDTAWAKGVYEGQRVIDYDFGALVYPKWIKVTSSSEVVSCVVNFNAGGGSGTGGGSGEAASTIEYLDISGLEDKTIISTYSILLKVVGDSTSIMCSAAVAQMVLDIELYLKILGGVTHVAIDTSLELSDPATNEITTINALLLEYYGSQFSSLPKITKEQFYAV